MDMKKIRIQKSQNNFEKEKVGRLKLPDFTTYYKATINKTVSHWHKERQTDQ